MTSFLLLDATVIAPPDLINHLFSLPGSHISAANFMYRSVQMYEILGGRFDAPDDLQI